MKVLVAGGTGFVGTALCATLLEQSHEVSALARDPTGATLDPDVALVEADVREYESLESPLEGHDAVVNLVSLSPLFDPPRGTSHEEVHLRGTEHLVRAAAAAGVDRFIQMSGLGVDPNGPTEFLRAKGRAEAVVRDSSLAWTIVRPSVVFGEGAEFLEFTGQLTTPYLTGLPGGGRTRFQPIWIGDLAPMLVEALATAHVGETYELGGPEVLTLADVTKRYYESRGRSVRILPVPMALATLGLTIAGPVPFVPFGPDQARSLRLDNTVEENDVTTLGRTEAELLTLGAYLGLETPVERAVS